MALLKTDQFFSAKRSELIVQMKGINRLLSDIFSTMRKYETSSLKQETHCRLK